jgi:SAM-dependent methyltransferase
MKAYYMQLNKAQYCRCCGTLVSEIMLSYSNMPSIAQNMSTDKLEAESSVVTLSITQCSACSLVQLLNSAIVPYYKDVIRSSSVSYEMMNFRRNQFSKFADSNNLRSGDYCEFGCGNGEYLDIMKNIIPSSFGVENSKQALENCKDSGLNVVEGFVQDGIAKDIRENSISSFGIFNFLEHLPDPKGYLKSIQQYLTKDAVGIIEVPNFDIMIKDGAFSDFSSEHLCYFTKNTLKKVLELSGYDVIGIKPIWHNHILSATVLPSKTIDWEKFDSKLIATKKEANVILNSIGKGGVVVWGGGHQSLAIIRQLDLVDRIDYIVDSSDRKIGKYAPGSGLKIKSPSVLLSDKNVKILLIIASSYSEEVSKIVLYKYGFIENIYIVDNVKFLKIK